MRLIEYGTAPGSVHPIWKIENRESNPVGRSIVKPLQRKKKGEIAGGRQPLKGTARRAPTKDNQLRH